MKKSFLIAAIVAALGGSALHFLYDVLPSPLVAVFAPINESPWEHLKLLFWPTLIAACVLARMAKHPMRIWSAFFLSELLMPIVLLGIFYLLVYLEADSLIADILLYFVTMFAGFFLAYFCRKSMRLERWGGFLLMIVILYGSMLILFTFAAPNLPVFQSA